MNRYFRKIVPEVETIHWGVFPENTQSILEADEYLIVSGDASAETIERMSGVEEIDEGQYNDYLLTKVGHRPATRPVN